MTWIRLRLAFLATVCTAVYVIGGIFGPAIAFACEGTAAEEPRLVNKEGKELVRNDFTGTSSASNLETVGRTQISCRRDTVIGRETAENSGTMTISLIGCTNSVNAQCTGGTGAANGELIIPVTWMLRRALPDFLILDNTLMNSPFRLRCGTINSEIRGSFLLSVRVHRPGTIQEFEIAQKEGVQEPDEYENEKKEKIRATLEFNIEEGAFEQAGIEGNEEITFEEEVEFLE